MTRPVSRPRLIPLVALLTLSVGLSNAGSSLAEPSVRTADRRTDRLDLPWRQAGLDEREAAAHLLDRFAFGARPGDVDRVVAMGLETWLERQLDASFAEPVLVEKLDPLTTLDLPLVEHVRRYPPRGRILREAVEAGIIEPPEDPDGLAATDRMAMRRKVIAYARGQGYRPQRDLLDELTAQKLLRAVYAENQLAEVLADFWYNHFYVSLADNQVRSLVLAYERDAVRPHILSDFRSLLGATARHPGMLLYLDNAQSTADEESMTTFDPDRFRRRMRAGARRPGDRRGRFGAPRDGEPRRPRRERQRGLNENYARELLELHTLGVDGGYTQEDVVEVARAFTGWSPLPGGEARERALARLERAERFGGLGFVVEGDFVFRADVHDAGAKRVLGRRLPAGRGIEDGKEVLDLVAAHPSTARHIATKLAVRFVSDEPPPELVDRLAETFRSTGGDLEAMVRAVAAAPEFWAADTRGAKIKTPFELVVSALRATEAEVVDPRPLVDWVSRLGQPLYAYRAPTGYPDTAEAWVNTGALLNRMNFGLELAGSRVGGVELDLAALAEGREPESRREALGAYFAILLPERDPAETLSLLAAMVDHPELPRRVAEAAPVPDARPADAEAELFEEEPSNGGASPGNAAGPTEDAGSLEQVVGVLLGSPEFQRR